MINQHKFRTMLNWYLFHLCLTMTLALSESDPYKVCLGTNSDFSSSKNEYLKWKALYSGCVFVDGNVELNNFDPYENTNKSYEYIEKEFDFSFLDDIKEITGYLVIHNTRLRTLRFKSLQLIRGKNLIHATSIFVDNNSNLEHLDLTNLREIERGNVFIQNNPNLCHMNEVNWVDIMQARNLTSSLKILDNADPSTCTNCATTCTNGSMSSTKTGCWLPNSCQKLSKVVCHERCGVSRCFGLGKHDCCSPQCSGGCVGPKASDCIGCAKLIIRDTGECVETCPRVQIPDPITNDLIINPNGMYQYGKVCVRKCPSNLFIYNEFCIKKCPKDTYEEEELVYYPDTGEKNSRRFCKQCTPQKCQKSCTVEGELSVFNIKNVQDCEVLNSDLIISRPLDSPEKGRGRIPLELEENDLKTLNSLRIINGFVRIQSNKLQNLSFLRNLETVRAATLYANKYSFVIVSNSIKTLGLNKLKSIENGQIYFLTEQLCLHDTINWHLITNKTNSIFVSKTNVEYSKHNCENEGYVCDQACKGCWSNGPKACQFCKTFKLDDFCIEQCEKNFFNGNYIYLNDTNNRECGYCHSECKFGCNGPSEYECKKCNNFNLTINGTSRCVEKCPISHYSDSTDPENKICLPCYKDCYGCTGPKDYITAGGCTKCHSALVNNDQSYTILKCIEKETYDCTNNEFSVLVPSYMQTHPLKGKNVCRKCNNECEECFDNGVKLNTQCKKCKNFYSNSTGECVRNCSNHKEYLDEEKKICLSCKSECKFGCTGSGYFQCNQCRTYKIKLEDLKRVLLEKINNGLLASGDKKIEDLNPYFLKKMSNFFYLNATNDQSEAIGLADMSSLISDYYLKKQIINITKDDSSIVFCVSDCPAQLAYKTLENFCTDDSQISASLWILSHELKILLAIVTTLVMILFTVFILSLAFCRYKMKMEKIYRKNEEKFFYSSFDDKGGFDDSKKMDMSDLRLVSKNQLKLEKMLGRGAFGTVHKGYYMPFNENNCKVRVAIKVLNKCKFSDEKSIAKLSDELINEAKVMASVDHEYCLRLTALCLAEPMMLVTQLMNHGSVVSFYQKYRDRVTEIMLLTWSKQIAEGMAYLESRGIVHRDLAARNILVKKFDHIKITDFGLARVLDSTEEGIYVHEHSLVPFKWLAIESMKSHLFNHKSDVWSYGICLWEIFTFCSKPYAEYPETDPQTIYNSIVKGTRLAKPQIATLDVYTILLRCWQENPMARPDFGTLTNLFSKMCLDPKRYLSIKNVDFNNPFKTIDDNTQDLLKEFKQNIFEENDDDRVTNHDGSMSELSSDKNHDKLLNEEDIDSELGSLNGVEDLLTNNHSKGIINTLFMNFNSNKHFGTYEKKNNVITFKRSNISHKINHLNTSKQSPRTMEKKSDNQNPRNKNFLKKFLINGLNKLPGRLESQMSTGTASTYLSYSCSSDSNPSPKLEKNMKKSKFNFYEEQEGLLGVEKHTNSYNFSLNTSRSNSNNSSRSTNTSIDQIKPIYKVNRLNSRNSETTTKTNSDYLEPIMTNVIQNLEYFSETNQKQLIQHSAPNHLTRKNLNRNYYNEEMSAVLDNKKQTLI